VASELKAAGTVFDRLINPTALISGIKKFMSTRREEIFKRRDEALRELGLIAVEAAVMEASLARLAANACSLEFQSRRSTLEQGEGKENQARVAGST
jgi:hypothetical protein